MLLVAEGRDDAGPHVGAVILAGIDDDAGHQVLENGNRLVDGPQRSDELAAAGNGPDRGVGPHPPGASKAAYGMLAVIEEFGPSSQADRGRRLAMDRRSVSDSRRNRLERTAAGRTLLAQLESSFQVMQDELPGSLSPGDRAKLGRLLALMGRPA